VGQVITISSEDGVKIAYVGVHPETGKTKMHSSFNPEFYLYRWNHVDKDKAVFFTPDLFECVRQIMGGHQAVCNFGLQYLSEEQITMLSQCNSVIFSPRIGTEIVYQAPRRLEIPLVFFKE
jgi:hypothetical protein